MVSSDPLGKFDVRVPTDDLDKAALALHRAVTDLLRVYQFRDRDKICCYDVSVTQSTALDVLARRGPLQLNELAAELFLDKSTASRVIDALQRKGYVERMPSLDDRRAVVLRTTASGRTLNEQIHSDLVEQQRALLCDLDPALRMTVANVVQRLAAAAEARFCAASGCGAANECCPALPDDARCSPK